MATMHIFTVIITSCILQNLLQVYGACTSSANVSSYSELVDAVGCGTETILLETDIAVTATIEINNLSGMHIFGSGYMLTSNMVTPIFVVTASTSIVFDTVGFTCSQSLPSGVGAITVYRSNVTLIDIISHNSQGPTVHATNSVVQLDGGVFSDNTCASSGGVLHLSNSEAVVNNTQFSDNSAFTYGGALSSFDSIVWISNCSFRGNSAGDETAAATSKLVGGGLFASGGSVHLTDVDLTGNKAYGGGGGTAFDEVIVVAMRVTWEDNVAYNGGGLAVLGGRHVLVNCTMTDNSAFLQSSQGSGGAVYVYGVAALTVQGLFCQDNAASWGGCALLSGNISMACADCVVSGNSALREGGGFHITSDPVYLQAPVVLLTGALCNISDNSAGTGGGLWAMLLPLLIMEDCEVSHNIATSTGDGGGLYLEEMDDVRLVRTNLRDNYAGGEGGGAFLSRSSAGISDSVIDFNRAMTCGGICLSGPSIATIAGCSMARNRADTGSALVVRDGSSAEITETIVEYNSASDAGTILVQSVSRLGVNESEFRDNEGGTKGGCYTEYFVLSRVLLIDWCRRSRYLFAVKHMHLYCS